MPNIVWSQSAANRKDVAAVVRISHTPSKKPVTSLNLAASILVASRTARKEKDHAGYFCLGTFVGDKRSGKNASEFFAIGYDFDNGATYADFNDRLTKLGYDAIMYHSFNSRLTKVWLPHNAGKQDPKAFNKWTQSKFKETGDNRYDVSPDDASLWDFEVVKEYLAQEKYHHEAVEFASDEENILASKGKTITGRLITIKPKDRFRVILFLKEPFKLSEFDAKQWTALYWKLGDVFGLEGYDKAAMDISRCFYFPAVRDHMPIEINHGKDLLDAPFFYGNITKNDPNYIGLDWRPLLTDDLMNDYKTWERAQKKQTRESYTNAGRSDPYSTFVPYGGNEHHDITPDLTAMAGPELIEHCAQFLEAAGRTVTPKEINGNQGYMMACINPDHTTNNDDKFSFWWDEENEVCASKCLGENGCEHRTFKDHLAWWIRDGLFSLEELKALYQTETKVLFTGDVDSYASVVETADPTQGLTLTQQKQMLGALDQEFCAKAEKHYRESATALANITLQPFDSLNVTKVLDEIQTDPEDRFLQQYYFCYEFAKTFGDRSIARNHYARLNRKCKLETQFDFFDVRFDGIFTTVLTLRGLLSNQVETIRFAVSQINEKGTGIFGAMYQRELAQAWGVSILEVENQFSQIQMKDNLEYAVFVSAREQARKDLVMIHTAGLTENAIGLASATLFLSQREFDDHAKQQRINHAKGEVVTSFPIERFRSPEQLNDYAFPTAPNKFLMTMKGKQRGPEIKFHQFFQQDEGNLPVVTKIINDIRKAPGWDATTSTLNVSLGISPYEPLRNIDENVPAFIKRITTQTYDTNEIEDFLTFFYGTVCNGNIEDGLIFLYWLKTALMPESLPMQKFYVIHGIEGTGKSVFMNLVAQMFYPSATHTGSVYETVSSKTFNAALENKALLIQEEIKPENETLIMSENFKNFITSRRLNIEAKGKEIKTVLHDSRVLMGSNHEGKLFEGAGARRYMPLFISTRYAKDTAFFDAFWKQHDRNQEFLNNLYRCVMAFNPLERQTWPIWPSLYRKLEELSPCENATNKMKILPFSLTSMDFVDTILPTTLTRVDNSTEESDRSAITQEGAGEYNSFLDTVLAAKQYTADGVTIDFNSFSETRIQLKDLLSILKEMKKNVVGSKKAQITLPSFCAFLRNYFGAPSLGGFCVVPPLVNVLEILYKKGVLDEETYTNYSAVHQRTAEEHNNNVLAFVTPETTKPITPTDTNVGTTSS